VINLKTNGAKGQLLLTLAVVVLASAFFGGNGVVGQDFALQIYGNGSSPEAIRAQQKWLSSLSPRLTLAYSSRRAREKNDDDDEDDYEDDEGDEGDYEGDEDDGEKSYRKNDKKNDYDKEDYGKWEEDRKRADSERAPRDIRAKRKENDSEKEKNRVAKEGEKGWKSQRMTPRGDPSQLKLWEGDSRIISVLIANSRSLFSDLAALARANGSKKLWTAVSYARLGHEESASKTNATSLRVGYSPLAADSSRSLTVIVSLDKYGTSLGEKNGDALEGELTSTGIGITLRGTNSIADSNFVLATLVYYGYGYNKASLGGAISRDLGSFNSHSFGRALSLSYRIEMGKTYSLVPTLTIDHLRSFLASRNDDLSNLDLGSAAINYGLEGSMTLTRDLELALGLGYSQIIAIDSYNRDRNSLNFSLRVAGKLPKGGNRLVLALAYRTAEGAASLSAVSQKGFSSLGRFSLGLELDL
jgi:hypothetical protein